MYEKESINEGPINDYGSSIATGQVMNETLKSENKIRDISIRELNRGYIVNVGCHSFAFSTSAELIAYLTTYILDPNKTEKNWFNGKLFS